MNTSVAGETAPFERLQGHRLMLVLMLLTQCLVVLLETASTLALAGIQADVGFEAQDLHWVLTAYLIGFGGLLMLGGRAADLIGRRRVLVGGLTGFTIASLACAVSDSPLALSIARALQGGGAAFASAAALSIVTVTFTGDARNAALSAWGIISAASASIGLLVGGITVDLLGWRWVFGLIVPIAGVTAVLSLRFVPRLRGTKRVLPLDIPGAVLCTGGVALLVFGLSGIQDQGLGATRTWTGLLAGTALMVALLAWERHAPDPLLPLWVFRRRSLMGANLASGIFGAVLLGLFIVMALYLQEGLDYSPIESGVLLLPTSIVSLVTGFSVGRLVTRFGYRPVIVVGLVVLSAGALALSASADNSVLAVFVPATLLFGIGISLSEISSLIGAMDELGHGELAGLASGLWSTAFQLLGAVGVAIVVTVAAGSTASGPAGVTEGFEQAALAAAGIAIAGAACTALLFRRREPAR
jgi:MFS family permease